METLHRSLAENRRQTRVDAGLIGAGSALVVGVLGPPLVTAFLWRLVHQARIGGSFRAARQTGIRWVWLAVALGTVPLTIGALQITRRCCDTPAPGLWILEGIFRNAALMAVLGLGFGFLCGWGQATSLNRLLQNLGAQTPATTSASTVDLGSPVPVAAWALACSRGWALAWATTGGTAFLLGQAYDRVGMVGALTAVGSASIVFNVAWRGYLRFTEEVLFPASHGDA